MDQQLLALRAFVRIAEAGSFGKAADTMNLPRSSVSKLLQDLEAHVGTKLFERTTRAVTITDDGVAYLERAKRILADIAEMDGAVASARPAPKGRLRVEAGSSIANVLLIPALSSFYARYPDIDLQLGISDRHANIVGVGIDCVLRTGSLPDTTMATKKLADLDWVTCATPEYLSRRAPLVHPTDLAAGHRVIGYFSAATGRTMPLRYHSGGEEIAVDVSPELAVSESTAHLNTILLGLGVAQTYDFMARPHLQSGALVEVLADWKPESVPLYLLHPAIRSQSLKLRCFADWVASLFQPD